jgi:hypothetical protein
MFVSRRALYVSLFSYFPGFDFPVQLEVAAATGVLPWDSGAHERALPAGTLLAVLALTYLFLGRYFILRCGIWNRVLSHTH